MAFLDALNAAAFSVAGTPVSRAELLGFLLAVWMVICNIRVNPLAWPLAMASSALYGLLFVEHRLYGEAGLQLLFIGVAGWGWWEWRFGRQADGSMLSVCRLGRRARVVAVATALAAWPMLALLLHHATDSDVPWGDAFPTVGSLLGQWLLARKYVENWPVWVVVNVTSVALFAWKELWLTTALYTLFALMALAGWQRWARLADLSAAGGAGASTTGAAGDDPRRGTARGATAR